jgi:DNA helicase-2/ATP-dependent DNA helicase PcrA
VLYRINAQSEVYEEALTEAGVPFQVRGGEGFFSRQEIRQALLALQRASEKDGARESEKLPEVVRAVLEPLGLTAEPPPGTRARERWEALTALAELVDEEVAQRPSLDLRALIAELRQRADARHPPVVQGVTLASLHAAKGLEWDAVFLVGLTDGTLPIQHADTPEEIEEERRLLYVGITRARSRLALSWSLSRHAGGRRSRRRSRFLTGLAPQTATPDRARGDRCRICGGRLTGPAEIKAARCSRCPSTADPELVAALRAWRRQRSAQASVPAFVVFSDATLLAIAERRPTDDAALLAIPGIGRSKLDAYGDDVIAIVTGTR